VNERVELLFKSYNWVSEEDRYFNLEKYRFMTNSEVAGQLSKEGVNVVYMSELPGTIPEKFTSIIYELEQSMKVLIRFSDTLGCIAYITPFSPIELDYLKASLFVSEIVCIYVTPYNFMMLKNPYYSDFDSIVMFKRTILDAIDNKATDVHYVVESDKKGVHYPTRMRIGMRAEYSDMFTLTSQQHKTLVSDTVTNLSRARASDLDTYGGIKSSIVDLFGDGKVTVRIAAGSVEEGFWMTCRIQTEKTVGLKIEDLGFGDEASHILRKVLKKESGLSLFTGKIRTGKNTTIFSLVEELSGGEDRFISDERKKLIIAEASSPIEYKMKFPQVDYNSDQEFLLGRTSLFKKQDLDVAVINEIPDQKIAKAAEDLFVSSVHVLTTLHIDRVWNLPHKLYQLYGEGYKNVFSSLNVCVNHKMFERLCEDCRVKHLSADAPLEYLDFFKVHKTFHYFTCIGCDSCNNRGVTGDLRPYVEWIYMTPGLLSELLKCTAPYEMEQVIRNEVISQNHTLERFVCEAIGQGLIPIESLDAFL
jgi:Tfp pilus assembly pilus retraction ATPase PilT